MPQAARVDHAEVRRLKGLGLRDGEIGEIVGCHPAYARLIYTGRVKLRSEGGSALSRKEPHALVGVSARLPPFDHAALMNARTIFPSTVVPVGAEPVLKSGASSAKIGRRIVKGRWKGFEVYTLTLEERATCPLSCRHWRSCYGNGSHQAHRFEHGLALEQRLRAEVAALAQRHPAGFAVRLHTLGDFYSPGYVALWRELLERNPQLHVFGFSARWDYAGDPIARALIDLVGIMWSRFAIRLSNAPIEQCSTVSIEHPFQKPAGAVICPQQLGKTAACATCALCWQSTKRIAFLQH